MAAGKLSNRWLVALGVLVGLTVSPLRAQQTPPTVGAIHWFNDLDEAIAAAEQRNLPMMIDFWADWCAPCKIMDAEVYTNPDVIQAFREKMIGVRIHFDLQPVVARKFGVEALPYLVFTNSYGSELMHHRGILEADDLSAVVNAFPADLSEINRLDRALQEDKNHYPSLRDMGMLLRVTGFYESSNNYLEKALKRDEAKKDAAQREPILYSMALNSLALRDGKQAASTLERCLKDFSKSTKKPDYMLALVRAYLLDEKQDKAKKTAASLIAEFPDTPAALSVRALSPSQ